MKLVFIFHVFAPKKKLHDQCSKIYIRYLPALFMESVRLRFQTVSPGRVMIDVDSSVTADAEMDKDEICMEVEVFMFERVLQIA